MATSDYRFGFRSPVVCRIAGVSYRQLDYWTRTGLITPSVHDAVGSGSARLWSRDDIVRLRVISAFLDAGVSLRKLRWLIEDEFANMPVDVDRYPLLIVGPDFLRPGGIDLLMRTVRHGAAAFVLSMASIVDDVNRQLDAEYGDSYGWPERYL